TKLGSPQIDDMLWAGLTDEYIGAGMGMTAGNLAEKYSISREEQDEYAYRSHMLAAKARKEGKFAEESVPDEVQTKKGTVEFKEDEHIREDTSREKLAKVKQAIKKDGTAAEGNASGITDGA